MDEYSPSGFINKGQCYRSHQPLLPFPPNATSNIRSTHHQKQIHIIQPQLLQTLLQPKLAARRVGGPDLGDDKDVLALDARGKGLGQPLADFFLVAVAVRAVDQSVPRLERVRYRGLDFAWSGLPCS